MIRTYSELIRHDTFIERYRYLALSGRVGEQTFGYDRYINQMFYRSREWRKLRTHVIARDAGCDLGVDGYEIYDHLLVHHMNPIRVGDEMDIHLDPEFLITTTHNTHNAIHYSDESLLPKVLVKRRPSDTKLW